MCEVLMTTPAAPESPKHAAGLDAGRRGGCAVGGGRPAGRHRDPRRGPAGAVPLGPHPPLHGGSAARGSRRGPETAPRNREIQRSPRGQCPARSPVRFSSRRRNRPPGGPLLTAATRSFDTSGVLRALRESPSHRAPASLLPAVLARVGLADRYWRLDSPRGTAPAPRGPPGISKGSRAKSAGEFERSFERQRGRPIAKATSRPPAAVR